MSRTDARNISRDRCGGVSRKPTNPHMLHSRRPLRPAEIRRDARAMRIRTQDPEQTGKQASREKTRQGDPAEIHHERIRRRLAPPPTPGPKQRAELVGLCVLDANA